MWFSAVQNVCTKASSFKKWNEHSPDLVYHQLVPELCVMLTSDYTCVASPLSCTCCLWFWKVQVVGKGWNGNYKSFMVNGVSILWLWGFDLLCVVTWTVTDCYCELEHVTDDCDFGVEHLTYDFIAWLYCVQDCMVHEVEDAVVYLSWRHLLSVPSSVLESLLETATYVALYRITALWYKMDPAVLTLPIALVCYMCHHYTRNIIIVRLTPNRQSKNPPNAIIRAIHQIFFLPKFPAIRYIFHCLCMSTEQYTAFLRTLINWQFSAPEAPMHGAILWCTLIFPLAHFLCRFHCAAGHPNAFGTLACHSGGQVQVQDMRAEHKGICDQL